MKKKITIIISLILAVTLGILSSAVASRLADKSEGFDERLIINRVNIYCTNTSFKFSDCEKGDELTCTLNFAIEKTEPEFYAMLNSLSFSGLDFTSTVFTAGDNNGTALFPRKAVIPSHEGVIKTLEWEISFSFIYDGEASKIEIPLTVDYTTGVSSQLTQRYLTNIPVFITVES